MNFDPITLTQVRQVQAELAEARAALEAAVTTAQSVLEQAIDGVNDNMDTRAPASTALSSTTWTAARAGYLDRLDASITTRAPASTALSSAIWTSGRAAKLDEIGGSPIRSIQRGAIAMSGTTLSVAVSAVNTAKSILLLSVSLGFDANGNAMGISGTIGSSTSLIFTSRSGPAGTTYPSGHWQLVEYV